MAKAVKKKAAGQGAVAKRVAKKRKGYVEQKAERGYGMKFKLETFATVASFTPGTRIKYGPNPKLPGSKSHTRYAGYMKAKTVGESLKLGSTKADFFWELERGHYQVLGTTRSEQQEVAAIGQSSYDRALAALASFNGPRGLATTSFNDPQAVEQLRQEEAWRAGRLKRCEELAKQMGLPVESKEEIEGESADTRLQRRVANELSERKLREADKAGKKVTDDDLSEVLHCWGFCENKGRLNVLPEGRKYVYSDTVGAIRRRTGSFGPTPPTKRYPGFVRLLCRWLADRGPKTKHRFLCTAINLNANYAGRRHRDGNNEGPSVIKAFGKFSGGRLLYWPKDTVRKPCKPKVETLRRQDAVAHDISKEAILFDGNRAHEVEPFAGERYSVVFFTSGGYARAAAGTSRLLKKAGFPWPTPAELAKLKRGTKMGKSA